MVCEWVVLLGTLGNALFPSKKTIFSIDFSKRNA